jgi:hypothetical protein
MSRADVSPQELKKLPNFYLYVDEFQSFANKSFADILSEARKYKLGLNITHQYIEQMAEEVRAAVFGNVGTMVTFRVGSYDAEILEKEFAPVFTMEDIVNLGFVQIYLKLMIDGVASQPFSATTLPPFPKPEVSFRDKALEMSRKIYTHPKIDVENTIKEWHAPEQKNESRSISGEVRKEPRKEETRRGLKIEEIKPAEKIVEPKKEIKYEQPKSNILAKAIEEATKAKENIKPAFAESSNVAKKETISLEELRNKNRNKNKEPSPENVNALKEALNKIQKQDTKEKTSDPASPSSRAAADKKEVSEEVLRKILKGE